jgi:hypothetical protein
MDLLKVLKYINLTSENKCCKNNNYTVLKVFGLKNKINNSNNKFQSKIKINNGENHGKNC